MKTHHPLVRLNRFRSFTESVFTFFLLTQHHLHVKFCHFFDLKHNEVHKSILSCLILAKE